RGPQARRATAAEDRPVCLMPGAKRTRIPRAPTPGQITPQVLALYRHAVELRVRARRRRTNADWQAAGDAENAVNRALSVRLWETSIFDVLDYPAEADGSPDWLHAAELTQQLDAALHELRRQERAARRAKAVPPSPPSPPSPSPSPPDQPPS